MVSLFALAQRHLFSVGYTGPMNDPGMAGILHTPIATLLSRYPQVSRVIIRHRMGCVGCAFSKFHSLHDALEIYQLQQEPFLTEIRNLTYVKDNREFSGSR